MACLSHSTTGRELKLTTPGEVGSAFGFLDLEAYLAGTSSIGAGWGGELPIRTCRALPISPHIKATENISF